MKKLQLRLGAALLAFACAVSPALAHPPVANVQTAADFEQDRKDILAMAGNFKVRFDMQESTRWDGSYTPLPPKVSGGNEIVRVIEDTGRKIVLQHILVMGMLPHLRHPGLDPGSSCLRAKVQEQRDPGSSPG